MYGAIEAGGTKFVCAVGENLDALTVKVFATRHPNETLQEVGNFLRSYKQSLKGIGIASFGPIDLHPASPTYGFITSTPKTDWAHLNLVGEIKKVLSSAEMPVAFDTDVNGAALGEACYGAGQGKQDFIYITIGTGIGGGIVANSELIHGLVHTELGHIFLPKHPEDKFAGCCPYHGANCFEGLASGPAIAKRWQIHPENLPATHPAWELQSWYVGAALSSLICSMSPQRIILGGGTMQVEGLIEKIRQQTQLHLNNYIVNAELDTGINDYIVNPGLGDRSGVIGAWELIRSQLNK